MDCRTVFILGLASLVGVSGCLAPEKLPVAATGTVKTVPEGTIIQKEPELPKRNPHPDQCVKWADWQLAEASAPRRSRLERDQMLDRARQAYQQALSIDPAYLPAYWSLARLYVACGQHERAVATYHKAVSIPAKAAHRGPDREPREATLWWELGMCHMRHKEWEPAVTALGKAYEIDPENRNPGYGNSLGFCLARVGKFEESLAIFSRSVGEAQAHFQLAQMLHHLKEDEMSKNHLRLALQINPNLTDARSLLDSLTSRQSAVGSRQ